MKATSGEDARPIILALSNPDSVAECTAEEAHEWSQGRAIYASGTTFPAFDGGDGKMYSPSQANNSLIFPGRSSDFYEEQKQTLFKLFLFCTSHWFCCTAE